MSIVAESVRTHPVVGAIGAAFAEISSVRNAALYGLADDELEGAIEGCEGLRAVVFDAELALVAEADGRDLGRRLGASSTAAWLRGRYRLRPGDARRLVDLANRVAADDGPTDYAANVRAALSGRELPATGAALAEGVISPEHVAVVGRVMQNLPKGVPVEKAQEVESDLAGFCRQFDPLTVAKLGDCVIHMLEADALDDLDADRHRKRELRLDEQTGRVSGQLTAEGLALLRTALDPLAAPAPASDGEQDPRSLGQRLADALVELARRAIAADSFEANHGISHRVMVMVGLDTLTAGHECPDDKRTHDSGEDGGRAAAGQAGKAGPSAGRGAAAEQSGGPAESQRSSECLIGSAAEAARRAGTGVPPGELMWGGAISAAAARRIACFAGIQRVVLDPVGAVLDVGREYRSATAAQFAALIARDGGCAFPGCTRPASWCIAHHLVHWVDGGPTDLDNLVLLCGYHHTVVHHHGWDVKLAADRLPSFYPPRWVDPDREPRRNDRPRFGAGMAVPDT